MYRYSGYSTFSLDELCILCRNFNFIDIECWMQTLRHCSTNTRTHLDNYTHRPSNDMHFSTHYTGERWRENKAMMMMEKGHLSTFHMDRYLIINSHQLNIKKGFTILRKPFFYFYCHFSLFIVLVFDARG